MGKDVDMADSGAPAEPEAKAKPAAEAEPAQKKPSTPLQDLRGVRVTIERAVAQRELRLMGRAIRQFMALRPRLTLPAVRTFLQEASPFPGATTGTGIGQGAPAAAPASPLSFLDQVPNPEDTAMEVEGESPAVSDSKASGSPRPSPAAVELEAFSYLLVLVLLIDRKLYKEAQACAAAAVAFLGQRNQRSLDMLAARIYFFFSLAHERTGTLADIRGTLLALNQTASLRRDEIGQEMLLNLLLRNYLHYNLYDQAEKLRARVQRPQSHSNQQTCRYLYYLGRIRAIQLEYSEAKDCLQQASRKAPSAALAFRVECTKWLVLVRLLLGEIPERSLFAAHGLRTPLTAYFQLTNAVRVGDLELFHSIALRHAPVFRADKTSNLIVRLRHNVIRTALRRISLAYSRISLADVAAKLQLQGPTAVEDAECIVAKAIRDGGIDAVIDRREGWMLSKETGDVYSTMEPQAAFHSRIAFCLNTHNEAVKALRFPPNAHKQEAEEGDKRRERQQQEQELAKHIAEEADGDF